MASSTIYLNSDALALLSNDTHLTDLSLLPGNDNDLDMSVVGRALSGLTQLSKLTLTNLGNAKSTRLLCITEHSRDVPLTSLTIHHCAFVSLYGIDNWYRLKELEVRSSNLEDLTDEIGDLRYLTRICIGPSSITEVHEGIGRLENLREFSIEHSQRLRALPKSLSLLTRLETLKVIHSSQKVMPATISAMHGLKFLDWSSNYSETIAEIDSLTALQTLKLTNNRFKNFPLNVCKLHSLTSLDLAESSITSLPPEISALVNLLNLSLRRNALTQFPVPVTSLTRLEKLDLADNNISSFCPEVTQLIGLKELILTANGLTALPKELCVLTNLEKLSLAWNTLRSHHFHPEFADLQKLIYLNLTHLELTELPDAVSGLVNLRTLVLMGNHMNHPAALFTTTAYARLTNLEDLNLSEMNIHIAPPFISQLVSLTKLEIGNPSVMLIARSKLPDLLVVRNHPS